MFKSLEEGGETNCRKTLFGEKGGGTKINNLQIN